VSFLFQKPSYANVPMTKVKVKLLIVSWFSNDDAEFDMMNHGLIAHNYDREGLKPLVVE
jgi:hypothetical protein